MSAGRTKSSGARKKTAGDKRERILRGAVKVFARKGFYDTKVSEIAKAAGVADGTIYLYFKNKDDVLISIFEEHINRLIQVLEELAAGEENVAEKLTRVVQLQLGLLEGQKELAEVVTVNLRQSTKLMKQYATPLFLRYLDVIASIVAGGQESGELRQEPNPRIVARAIWGAIDGIALTWAMGKGGPPELRKAARQYADLLIEGLRQR